MRQAEALAILQSGASVFLTGAPGAGKTYVLNEFVRQARAEGAAGVGDGVHRYRGHAYQRADHSFMERCRTCQRAHRQSDQNHTYPTQT